MQCRQDTDLQTDFFRNVLNQIDDGVYVTDLERRITYWNKGAEKISGYTNAEVVGKCCSDNLIMHIDDTGKRLCKDHCPLWTTMAEGSLQSTEAYLHHKDGHRIPVYIRTSALYDGRGKIIGAVETFSDNSSRMVSLERIKELEDVAYIDLLTGVANRRYTQFALEARFAEKTRYDWHFGLIMCDVDHFKQFNDRYGHEVGDRVLQMVAKTLNHNLRSFDLVGRWGGEEFLVIVANVDEQSIEKVANHLRALVEQSSLTVGSEQLGVTISVGAAIANPKESPNNLVNRADRLMYQSKTAGRNKVSVAM